MCVCVFVFFVLFGLFHGYVLLFNMFCFFFVILFWSGETLKNIVCFFGLFFVLFCWLSACLIFFAACLMFFGSLCIMFPKLLRRSALASLAPHSSGAASVLVNLGRGMFFVDLGRGVRLDGLLPRWPPGYTGDRFN